MNQLNVAKTETLNVQHEGSHHLSLKSRNEARPWSISSFCASLQAV